MGQPALPDDWRHHLARGYDRRPYGHLRLPRYPTAHGPYNHTPYADLLTDGSSPRCYHGVCGVLLRLSLRPAARTCRGSAGEPGAGHSRGHTWAVSCAGEVAGSMSGILWLCFTISGAAALALEVLWMRSAGLVLGATAPTAATVLACYFAGLGLGAASARCKQQRPVRLYGLLELGAGLGAFWSLSIFRALASDPAQAWLAVSGPVGCIAAVAVALLPATLCLGATLPAIAQALITTGSVGHRGGLLYAINTLGGVLGTVAMGFGLPAMLGVSASYSVAAGASILTGVGALALSLRQPER